MKTYGRLEVIAPPFLALALDGGEWSASHLCCFSPGRDLLVSIGWGRLGGMGPRAGLAAVEKRNISFPSRKLNPGHPAHNLLLCQLFVTLSKYKIMSTVAIS
jgi:hypothetical protein